MAPYLSLLPVRKDKRSATQIRLSSAAPPAAAAPASPPPIDFERYFAASPAPPARPFPKTFDNADVSVLDFSSLLQGGEGGVPEMLNDEEMSFLADESFVTVIAVPLERGKETEQMAVGANLGMEMEVGTPAAETPVVAVLEEVDPFKKVPFHPRVSLGPLRSIPAPVPVTSVPSTSAPIPVATADPGPGRARQSLSRPAHILPRNHPAHPRQSLAFPLPPPVLASVEEPALKIESSRNELPKRSALKFSNSGSEVLAAPCLSASTQSRPSSLQALPTSTSSTLSVSTPALALMPASIASPAISAIQPSPSLSVSTPFADDMFARRARNSYLSKGTTFDHDGPLPEVGFPLDLTGMTSTPARLPTNLKDGARQRRRTTMAVTFALPDLEDPQETVTVNLREVELGKSRDEDEDAAGGGVDHTHDATSHVKGRHDQPAPQLSASSSKRRASRAFETAAPETTTTQPLSSSTSRRASRAFASSAPTISSTPGTSMIQSQSLSSSLTLPPAQAHVNPPVSPICLTASAGPSRSTITRPLPSNPMAATTKKTNSKSQQPSSVALTLPCDFNFGARAAEREAEKKKRAEERQKAREMKEKEEVDMRKRDGGGLKRKGGSAWAASSTKEVVLEKEEGIKRQKLASSLPAEHSSALDYTHRTTILHFSAPATRQPRSRPSHVSSFRRRSSSIARELAELPSSTSTALTKEALAASGSFGGLKIDLKRRVSQYLEGVLEGVPEEAEDGEREQEEKSRSPVAQVTEHVALEGGIAPAKKIAHTPDKNRVPSAARRPLAHSSAHDQTKDSTAPLPKPATKAQPFKFSSTISRRPPVSSSPIFDERLSVWKGRESTLAKSSSLNPNPNRIMKANPMPIFVDPPTNANFKRQKVVVAAPAEDTMFLRAEKRRAERESWERKQREREEEIRKLKQKQRAEEAEQERFKLKQLREALVIHPHPVPAWIHERKMAARAEG